MSLFSRLTKASDYEVSDWIKKEFELSNQQIYRAYDRESVRFSNLEFYKRKQKENSSLLWRLTLPLFGLYWVLLFIGLPISFIITGEWGYNQKFLDNFHYRWCEKLNVN
jgi:hypothetical protein